MRQGNPISTDRKTTAVKRSKRRKRVIIWSIIGTVALLVALISPVVLLPVRKTVRVYVREGQTATELQDSLAKQSGSEWWARNVVMTLSVLSSGKEYHDGYYEFGKATTPAVAAIRINGHRQTPVKVSIVNKRTRAEILDYLASRLQPTAEELDSALNAAAPEFGLTPQNATDIFMDETFEFWWTASPEAIIKKIGTGYERFWTRKRREQAKALGLTPPEVMVLASIVQEESNIPEEHGRIGRLYINRLQKGMRLQADPTVRFAMNDFTIKRITRPMLLNPSPYNTYRISGLPPSVICTVRGKVVDAILNSSPSDDLYMCARPDFSGSHNFASDYATHLHNARQYQDALDKYQGK